VVTFIAYLINYRTQGSLMKLSVGTAKMNLRPSVTEDKLNNQQGIKKSDTPLNIAFYFSKWLFF